VKDWNEHGKQKGKTKAEMGRHLETRFGESFTMNCR